MIKVFFFPQSTVPKRCPSGRAQFLCLSYIGTQSGIFRVLRDINRISFCKCKTADTLSLPVSSSSTTFNEDMVMRLFQIPVEHLGL